MELFYEVRSVRGLKKKPSTSELIDWIKLLMVGKINEDELRTAAKKGEIPLLGAIVKNEQDLALLSNKKF